MAVGRYPKGGLGRRERVEDGRTDGLALGVLCLLLGLRRAGSILPLFLLVQSLFLFPRPRPPAPLSPFGQRFTRRHGARFSVWIPRAVLSFAVDEVCGFVSSEEPAGYGVPTNGISLAASPPRPRRSPPPAGLPFRPRFFPPCSRGPRTVKILHDRPVARPRAQNEFK